MPVIGAPDDRAVGELQVNNISAHSTRSLLLSSTSMDPSSIKSLLFCSICNNPLSNPSTLHCGHTICSKHRSCTLHSPPVDSERKVDVSAQKIIELVNRHSVLGDRNPDEDDGSPGRPQKRPRTIPQDEDDQEIDLLAHLRSESARQRTLRHDEPVIPTQHRLQPDSAFEKDLVTELSCEICFSLLYEPVTTPCQHVSFPPTPDPSLF